MKSLVGLAAMKLDRLAGGVLAVEGSLRALQDFHPFGIEQDPPGHDREGEGDFVLVQTYGG